MAVNFTTLFTKLGTIIYYQKQINVARGTTIPPLAKAILDDFNSDALPLRRAIEGIEASSRSFQNGASGAMGSAQTALGNVIMETLQADAALDAKTLDAALESLFRQMTSAGESVDASTTSTSTATGSSNNGDGVIVLSSKRADGRNVEHAYTETIFCEVTDDTDPTTATLTCKGDAAIADMLSSDWPGGSGSSSTVSFTSALSSLLGNGGFDDFEDVANSPDDWYVSVGTIGTTLKETVYEVQAIAVTGPPTAGTYQIKWTNQDGDTQATAQLAYDASGDDVQAALRALIGLEEVEVTTTGTSPLYTHTITFTGVAGNLSQVTINNLTTGGTYTPSTTTGGSANAFVRKALEFDSNGVELTAINRLVELEPLSQYAINLFALADVVPAAGVFTVDLIDGISGGAIADEQGIGNSFTFTGAGLTTSFVAKNGVFRTPRVLPPVTYIRIRISTAVSNGTSVFIDHAALVKMVELYPGGPSIAAFSGKTPMKKGNAQNPGDNYTVTVTNNRAGEFQEWLNRNFDLANRGLLVPSNSAGAETQADSLIA